MASARPPSLQGPHNKLLCELIAQLRDEYGVPPLQNVATEEANSGSGLVAAALNDAKLRPTSCSGIRQIWLARDKPGGRGAG